MKSKKKFLLLGVGTMGVLALGVGTVSTFAWFQADTIATAVLKNNADDSIRVAGGVEIAGLEIQIPLEWDIGAGVTPSAGVAVAAGFITGDSGPTTVAQEVGGVYALDHNGNIVAVTNLASLKRSELVTITADDTVANIKKNIGTHEVPNWVATNAEDRDLLDGVRITIQVNASDQLRIATSRTGKVNEAADTNNYVGAYTAGAEVTIGTIDIASDGGVVSFVYDSVLDINSSTDDEGLNLYYSVSPKNNKATGEATNVAYGTLTASVESQGSTPAP